MVWLVGELEKGQTNSILGAGARGVPQNNLNLEAVKFWQRFALPITLPLTKTVSKHVLGIMDIQYITTLDLHLRQQRILSSPTGL
jgi:hypothetical protein